ncbi:MAG: Rpn family recombination-promoting nuclease/putative transposase [Candidatus Cardinium sp.]|uniref:Rpn family recombination-promoting nuclease/putative transposase n=1 Tax=Cardinium endosymbiont of Dermatophagoides farinae TaxID=2597823 RepID=UPI00118254C5|nr:Rpn family recombination-promoting nuclease/putative transposase [Cardinium endosymbiont of Dermatophagoides farinae]TSJ81045.1 Rpn family recombination-promoting nuclease/putative transposase [Cardinium endosymbiont of Dermatophagoides farinae]UWW97075.1 MAG: Rpn family recombination-promoting nuclease/putative transposase [Candidatus Cardinium sp.]
MEKITPRIDLAFKKIFGVEENKDLLISLINATVSPEDQVCDVTLLNPYNAKSFRSDKLSILDVKAVGETGKIFNIEIQITNEADYDKRALYYWAKLYTDQLKAAQHYSTLNKAIGIHILNFTSIPDSKKYHNVFHITEKESGMPYFSDLELHTVELVKFSNDPNEDLSSLLKKVKNELDIWIAFLTRHDLLKDNLPEAIATDSLKKALHVLDTMKFTDEERMAYEDHLKWLRIEANTIEKFQKEAKEKGRQEVKIEIAKTMLEKGYAIDDIVLLTGLSTAEIKEIM